MTKDNIPEYHFLFEDCFGDVNLKVRFAEKQEMKNRSFQPKQIQWKDVLKLFGGPDGMPYEKMGFDEWPFTVKKIEIEPAKRQVTLVIK